jgi:CRISPR-associated protein Cpf1
MKKIDNFIGQYPLSKTLRFKLIPVGETLKNFEFNNMLEEDERRAANYAIVKKLIDEYHRDFINRSFVRFESSNEINSFINEVSSYADAYYKSGKDENDKKAMRISEGLLRKYITTALTTAPEYGSLNNKNILETLLPEYLEKKNDFDALDIVKEFSGFSTYFTGFFDNRKNMYVEDEKSTAIAYRCINENLPKFLDNVKIYPHVQAKIAAMIKKLDDDFDGIYGTAVEDLFSISYFPFVLSQNGIDKYNCVIGGYTCSDGTKIQGLNEYINLYNQTADKADRIPKLKQLYKQVLSNAKTISFIPDKFETDNELLQSVDKYFLSGEKEDGISIKKCTENICKLFNRLTEFSPNGIFVRNNLDLTTVCAGVFDYYGAVEKSWNDEYDLSKSEKQKKSDKYFDVRKKSFKSNESFSFADIQKYGSTASKQTSPGNVFEWFKNSITECCSQISETYLKAESLLSDNYTCSKKLYNNDDAVETIKNALDSVKELEKTMGLVLGTGKEESKDEAFYGEFYEQYDRLSEVDRLYDKVRNYLTQKPYKTDKIKLNFQNPQFLGGWDRNKERDYSSVLLRKGEDYFVAIMDDENRSVFQGINYYSSSSSDTYQKMIYKQIPNAAKYISGKQILPQNPPEDIKYILEKKKKDSKSLSSDEIHRFIDYCKNDFLVNYSMLLDEFGRNYYDFKFKQTEDYKTINDFFIDVDKQAYSLQFVGVSNEYIDSLVKEGKIYLFQIYNKDFSKNKKGNGTPNLHTLYFKMLFDDVNLRSGVIALNGGAEMF